MTISLSMIANTAFAQMFRSLDGLLVKASADAKARGIDEAVYLNSRLAPDMFPLVRQVQVATEVPLRTMMRLAGEEPASFADDETSFAQLRERIASAQAQIKDLSTEAIDADPDGPITFPVGPEKEMTLPRRIFLQNMILPNLYFHTTMTYAILRHLGVTIGKMDFLAVPQS